MGARPDDLQVPIRQGLSVCSCLNPPGQGDWATGEGATGKAHPDHIDSDQHVDGVVAGNALEHAVGGVVSGFPGHILWEWHFVHAEGALGKASVGQDAVSMSTDGAGTLWGQGLNSLVAGSWEDQGVWRKWPGQQQGEG